VSGLNPSTSYSFYLIARDAERNSSPASTTVDGTTTAAPTGGDSFRNILLGICRSSFVFKALEIANLQEQRLIYLSFKAVGLSAGLNCNGCIK
jgi:hypothetical protein